MRLAAAHTDIHAKVFVLLPFRRRFKGNQFVFISGFRQCFGRNNT
jgi:hypothetical protein